MDKAIIEKLKSEHGTVYVLTAEEDEIVVRMPVMPEIERFFAGTGGEVKKVPHATTQLVRDVLVHPSVEDFNAMITRRPGVGIAFSKEVSKIAGITIDVEAKKY